MCNLSPGESVIYALALKQISPLSYIQVDTCPGRFRYSSIVWGLLSWSLALARQGFISKLVPQPQLLVAAGFPTILNWLPINSVVKSTLLPFSSSRLGSSIITFAPEPSLDSNTVSSSGDIAEVLVRAMRYWKPWHPPDSTVTRRARLGLESLDIISLRRWDRC